MNLTELKDNITQTRKNLKKSFIAVKEDIFKLQKTNSKFINRFKEVEFKIENCSTKKYVSETLLKNNYEIRKKISKINNELRNREIPKKD